MLLMAVVMVRPLHVINELIYDKGHEHRLAIDGDEEVQGLNLLGARGYADASAHNARRYQSRFCTARAL